MPGKQSLSATNLAAHQHLNCDLYVYNIYHRYSGTDDASPSELAKAQFQRGLDWETCLYTWLDATNLLLKVPILPLDGDSLLQNILFDERDHFFITGLTLWPPEAQLNERFERYGTQPFKFGQAKPDLVEIEKKDGSIKWRVIDAKASKLVKTSHHIQVYFYTICLKHLLSDPLYKPMDTAGVWLPPPDGFYSDPPSLENINAIRISLLSDALDRAIFRDLPRILHLPHDKVKWHYNPLCHGCKFEPECRQNARDGGFLGSMPNISIEEARNLKDLLNISSSSSVAFSQPSHKITDIEELHELVKTPNRLDSLSRYSALTVKRAKATLALPKKQNPHAPTTLSPVVEAARTQRIQIIPRRNHTCPVREDIAVVISIIHDPASPNPGGEYFCISTFSKKTRKLPSLVSGLGEDFVFQLAEILRSLTSHEHRHLTTQFYVWSPAEHSLIQSHIINAALSASASDEEVRLCIGALAQGVSLLKTTFQPQLLSGTLLTFLGKERRKRAEYVACLERLGISTEGNVEALRQKLDKAIRDMQNQDPVAQSAERSKELGQLPRIVVLKKEVERQIALPIPGYWDLPNCVEALVSGEIECPSDEETFLLYKQGHLDQLEVQLQRRNECILSVLRGLRTYAVSSSSQSFFVNEAKTISTSFMDLCLEPNLRKLFFMQQFEVLTKLTELSSTRLEGCPDAALLEYVATIQGTKGIEHVFRLLGGNVDASLKDREGLFDFLLSGDPPEAEPTQDPYEHIPVEALFDDLAVSGLIFPLNRWTRRYWDLQDKRVQDEICVADIRNVFTSPDGTSTEVTIRTWGPWKVQLRQGQMYRLSPRLVDFNTNKILSSLFEMDLRWGLHSDPEDLYEDLRSHHHVPYVQLIVDPSSFGPALNAHEFLVREAKIQNAFVGLQRITSSATPLVLKDSQHRAAQRIMGNRLSVVWGPPGTGKTFTIATSLLRLIEVQSTCSHPEIKVVFITAMTHAAIEACYDKLNASIRAYRSLEGWSIEFLDHVRVELVQKGSDHQPPPSSKSSSRGVRIYAGTIFQLYNFTKKHAFDVDCLVIDEAGQISLGAVSLVMRSLTPSARVIIAGDSEQLAPILSAQYPRLKTNMLFGSVLDSLMFARFDEGPPESQELIPSQNTVVQLTENFRLNPDLAEFVSLIYARKFQPQKLQNRQIVTALQSLMENPTPINGIQAPFFTAVQSFFAGLLERMMHPHAGQRPIPARLPPRGGLQSPNRSGTMVMPVSPRKGGDVPEMPHFAVSLALLRLQTRGTRTDDLAYEAHVRGEAALAVCLAVCLRRAMPHDDVFIATPHRIQREAVRTAIGRLKSADPSLRAVFGGGPDEKEKVRVDTIERLQGAEAAFVICLFSLPKSYISDLPFLLERRRLNVAISRAKNLCILISSDEVLCPSVRVLANQDAAKGYAFLKDFEARAWTPSAAFMLNVDHIYPHTPT